MAGCWADNNSFNRQIRLEIEVAINPNAVGAVGKSVERSWDYRDSLLYSVGIGAGAEDPFASELEFTTNNSKNIEQKTFPTQGVVIGFGDRTSW